MKKIMLSFGCLCITYLCTIAKAATAPGVNISPANISLATTYHFASAISIFTVSAHDLPAGSGSITVSTYAAYALEFALSGSSGFTPGGVSIPYTNGQLSATDIQVRISDVAFIGGATDIVSATDNGPGNTSASINVTWLVDPNTIYLYTDPSVITGLSTSLGVASGSVLLYTGISPQQLLISGTLIVSGSPFLEFSSDGINYQPTLSLFWDGSVTSPLVSYYARISSTAPQGPFSGMILLNGYAVEPDTVMVGGGVARMFYNTKAALGLNDLGSWSSTLDGTGASPASFSEFNNLNVVDPSNTVINGVWDLGQAAKLSVGDGVTPITLIIPPGADSITSASIIDVNNHATLRIFNNRIPSLNNIDPGSTIDFAQTGIGADDVIKIPAATYGTLKLTNGLKYFDAAVSVNSNLIVDGVASFGGSKTAPSVVTCSGNVSFLNGTTFETAPSGDSSRIVLAMQSFSLPVQNIISDGAVVKLLLLQKNYNGAINLSPGTEMQLGGALGGGLILQSANDSLTTTGGKISFVDAGAASVSYSNGAINSNGTSFEILKSADGSYPQSAGYGPGKLIFSAGSVVNNFTVNLQNYTPAYDNIGVNDVTITGTLNLQNGKLLVNAGSTLSLAASVTLLGGSVNSYVDGALKRTGTSAFRFPVGNGNKYAPVDMFNYSGNDAYTVQYTKHDYASHLVDPATLALYPGYTVSDKEYWAITPASGGGQVDLAFNYTDTASHITSPDQLRMAHFDGTDWNDLGGTPGAANSYTNGKVTLTGVSAFSPFTFSGANSTVVPLKLSVFTAKKDNNAVKINWTTEQEINSKSFIVERSTDQHVWNEITALIAAGTSFQKINYTTTDFNPAKGINYYLLKQIDLDGKFSYSEIRSVYFGDDVNVAVLPNPASGKVNVYLPGNATNAFIIIYNVQGQIVKKLTLNEEAVQIDLAGLPKGVYSIKVTGKNLNAVRKLVVK